MPRKKLVPRPTPPSQHGHVWKWFSGLPKSGYFNCKKCGAGVIADKGGIPIAYGIGRGWVLDEEPLCEKRVLKPMYETE